MASKATEDAIESYLTANWTNSPILTENAEGETPADGSPYIVLQFPAANVRRLPISNRHYQVEGGFRIVINVQRGSGTATIREWGEDLATLFRDQNVNGVKCVTASEPFTDEESDQGNYFQGAMVIEYTRDFDG